MANSTYTALIARAIKDFDDIFAAMLDRGVQIAAGSSVSSGAYPTDTYQTLIREQLYTIGNDKTGSLAGSTNGNMASFAGLTKVAAGSGHTLTYSGSSVVIDTLINDAGYYDNTSHITKTITTTTASLSGSTPTLTGATLETGSSAFTIKPNNDTILGGVSISKGSYTPVLSLSPITGNSTATASIQDSSTLSSSTVKIAEATLAPESDMTGDTTGNFFWIPLLTASTYSAETNGTVSGTFSAGYITALGAGAVLNGTASVTNVAGNGAAYGVKLNKAAVTYEIEGSASVDIAPEVSTVSDSADGYLVTPKYTFEQPTLSVTAGYLGDSTQISATAISTSPAVTYIKRGNLGSASANSTTVAIAGALDFSSAPVDNAYSATLTVNHNYSKAVTDGYIDATHKTFEATITGETVVSVAAGSATVTPAVAQVVSGASIYNTSSGDYEITISATATNSKTVSAGYVKDADVHISNGGTATSIYIVKGSVSTSASMSIAVHSGTAEDGPAETPTESPVSVFTDSVTGYAGDYYEITVNPSATVQSGYTTQSEVTNGTAVKKYLKKAQLSYVETSTGAGSFIQVTQGGYIPSGFVAEVSSLTASTPDYAAITLTAQGSGITFASSSENAVEFSLSKTVNPGYISESDGTVTLSNGYIPYAGLTLGAGATATVGNTPVKSNGSYAFSGTATVTAGLNATAGYLDTISGGQHVTTDLADATLAGYTVAGSTTTGISLTIDEVALQSTTAINAALTSDGVILSDDSASGYAVVSSVSEAAVKVDASTAGYLATGVTKDVTLTKNSATKYVKKGTKLTTVSGANDTATLTGAAQDHSYIVSLSSYGLVLSGTLEEGYYKGSDLNVSGTAVVAAKSLTITPAALTVNNGATINVDTTATEVIYQSASATNYYAFVVSGNSNPTVTLGASGYIDNISQVSTTAQAISAKGYIKGVETVTGVSTGSPTADEAADTAVTTTSVNVITVGAFDGSTVDYHNAPQFTGYRTEGTYSARDTVARLGADAMGVNVVTELDKLERRLAGLSVSS